MKRLFRNILLGFAIWTAYNFLNAGILSIQENMSYSLAWFSTAVANYMMALLSIPLWYSCKKFPFNKSSNIRFFGIHFLASIFFTLIWLSLTYGFYWVKSGEAVVKFLFSQGVHMWQFLDGLTKYGLLVGIFYTISFYQKFKEKELKETELNLLTKNMELQNLKSQINPHFLFNALNSVNALMAQNPEKARTMNAKLAELLRFSLEGYESKFVTLNQELKFIRNYLDIEKIRFGHKLRINEEISGDVLEEKVPSMLLQPIVENAIKHGISKEAKGGQLTIRIFKKDSLLNFEIANTGKSARNGKLQDCFEKGIGLKNTHERLKRIYGDPFGLELRNLPEEAFTVKIKIPLSEKS